MGIFEYAASILSIVLGLAVAHLLGGVAWIIRAPKTGPIFWVFSSWCFVMLLVIIGWWWGIWAAFKDLEELSFWDFLPPFVVSTLLYVGPRSGHFLIAVRARREASAQNICMAIIASPTMLTPNAAVLRYRIPTM